MSTKQNIQLSIFDPLGEYFKIMYDACDGDLSKACSSDTLKSALASDECDGNGGSGNKDVSEKFKKALKLFVLNLKTFDSPISSITIKGQLYDIFTKVIDNVKIEKEGETYKISNGVDIHKELVEAINNNKIKLLNMEEDTGLGLTSYSKILKDIIDYETYNIDDKTKIINDIFNKWLISSFSVYDNNQERFVEFMEDIKNKWNDENYNKVIEPAHIKAFNFFFEIIHDGTSFELTESKNFWDSPTLINILNSNGDIKNFSANTRINVKVVDTLSDLSPYKKPPLNAKNLKAGIAFAFPNSVQKEFNEALILKNQEDKNKINEDIYKIKSACAKGSYSIDKTQVKDVLKFIKSTGTSSMGNRGEAYVNEFEDQTPYTDEDGNSSTFDGFNKIMKEYNNTWAKDYNGNLYTRLYKDGINQRFIKYTEKQIENDIKSFTNKDGNCGHLCIFSDPKECDKFFKNMTEGKEITYDKLAEMINENNFSKSYDVLKENIVKVNPVFVIGTLKAFKFEKWEKLNNDGTKTIKVESFSRWWKRKGQEFMKEPGLSELKKHENRDKSGTELFNPQPPENLQLFLKLLVSFINYNEFVLNPQSSNTILNNRLVKTTTDFPNTDNVEFLYMMEGDDRVKVPNPYYKGNKTEKDSGVSLASELMQLNKINKFTPIEPNAENSTIFNQLNRLNFGWSPYGKLLFSKSPQFSTGHGFMSALHGGASVNLDDPSDIKQYRTQLTSIARQTFDTFIESRNNLSRKNKTIDKDSSNQILDSINKLSMAEYSLYESLNLIGKYQRVVNDLGDNDAQTVGLEAIQKEVDNYKNIANGISSKSDGITSMMAKVFNVPTSGYSKLL